MANRVKAKLLAILPFLPFIILLAAVVIAVHHVMNR